MSQREIEARLTRMTGGSPGAQEYVEQQTKDLEWFGFLNGALVKGTIAELQKLAAEVKNGR